MLRIRTAYAMLAILLAGGSGCATPPPAAQLTGPQTEYLDNAITEKVRTAILNSGGVNASGINVTTFRGMVVLSGFVRVRPDALAALHAASAVDGVNSVSDETQVRVVVEP